MPSTDDRIKALTKKHRRGTVLTRADLDYVFGILAERGKELGRLRNAQRMAVTVSTRTIAELRARIEELER